MWMLPLLWARWKMCERPGIEVEVLKHHCWRHIYISLIICITVKMYKHLHLCQADTGMLKVTSNCLLELQVSLLWNQGYCCHSILLCRQNYKIRKEDSRHGISVWSVLWQGGLPDGIILRNLQVESKFCLKYYCLEWHFPYLDLDDEIIRCQSHLTVLMLFLCVVWPWSRCNLWQALLPRKKQSQKTNNW